jgi:RNA polymerase sigma factor (sigma-70 family)
MSDFDPRRDPLDVLAEDFAERCRRGEQPSVNTYVQKYPQWAGRIRELLPPVAKMEELKRLHRTVAQLEEALDRLRPADREVLTLRHFEELDHNEVADNLGINTAAASMRYVRAVTHLKEVLANMPGFFDEQP